MTTDTDERADIGADPKTAKCIEAPSMTRRTLLGATGTAAAGVAAEAGTASAADRPDFGGWFDNVSNYDGIHDLTGKDRVTVEVGAKGNNGYFAFAPAAIRVSPGTTVVWRWTGKGGRHNIVHTGGVFKSQLTAEKGFTFEYTFTQADVYKYYCTPHKALGMKGAVVVGDAGPGSADTGKGGKAKAGEQPRQTAPPRLFGIPLKMMITGTLFSVGSVVIVALVYDIVRDRFRDSAPASSNSSGEYVRRIGESHRRPRRQIADGGTGTTLLGRLTGFDSSRVRAVLMGWGAFTAILLGLSAVLAGMWYLTGGGTVFLFALVVVALALVLYSVTSSRSIGVSAQWFFTDARGQMFALVAVGLMLLVGIYLTAF